MVVKTLENYPRPSSGGGERATMAAEVLQAVLQKEKKIDFFPNLPKDVVLGKPLKNRKLDYSP